MQIQNLGNIGSGTANYDHNHGIVARHPDTGAEYIVHPTFAKGFIVFDPRKRTSRHVRPKSMVTGRTVLQGHDGALYQSGGGKILRWDWRTTQPRVWFTPKKNTAFPWFDIDHLGNLYFSANPLHAPLCRCRPGHDNHVATVADAATAVCSRLHACVYLCRSDRIEQLDPLTGMTKPVLQADGSPCPAMPVFRDGGGRLLLTGKAFVRAGRTFWLELLGDRAVPVVAATTRVTDTLVSSCECFQAEPNLTFKTPYVLQDGTYVSRIIGPELTLVDPEGRWHTAVLRSKPVPLQPFCLTVGDEHVWIGSILPLNLVSWNLKSGQMVNHGCPTPSMGEIYNMRWSGNRLFFVSYTHAQVTRYDPRLPWRLDRSEQANPRQFGPMIAGETCLHRSYGKTVDEAGNVYFAAAGDYGCRDSGICRIDIESEAFRVWTYPETALAAMVYVRETGELLLAERRVDEDGCRISTVNANDGKRQWSQRLFPGGGRVNSWIYDGGGLAFGIHDASATIFAFDVHTRRIVRQREFSRMGHYCYNSLLPGPDGRLWGLTAECVYAVDRDLREAEVLYRYAQPGETAFYRFGFDFGPDGWLYFLKNNELLRLTW